MASSSFSVLFLPTLLFLGLLSITLASAPSVCRPTCGGIPIRYPFGVDDGCGSPHYRRILDCSSAAQLHLRTPSGRYPVKSIAYDPDPHILASDPSMWTCADRDTFRPARPFSLDTGTRLSVSPQNDFIFFNCSDAEVAAEPKPLFCEQFPDRCDSSCDTAGYLCRHLPDCGEALRRSGASCCSYYPRATESLRIMLRHCAAYTCVYWRITDGGAGGYSDQKAEYGIRIDFDIPVTAACSRCREANGEGGTCGFDTATQGFLCLCGKENSTSTCKDGGNREHVGKKGVIAGTVSGISGAGALGVGAGLWYLRKVRAKAPVTCGVQTNENRFF